jgi:hypothetical protein
MTFLSTKKSAEMNQNPPQNQGTPSAPQNVVEPMDDDLPF